MPHPSQTPAPLAAGGRLLVASRNPRKLAELLRLLADAPIELVGLDGFPDAGEVEETGTTFAENAALKAVGYCRATGLPAVADDSGLEVDALGGAPGVRSARYGGGHGDDAANVAKLLAELADVPPARRTARFRCCVAVADGRGVLAAPCGVCEGRIAAAPRGANGFGYDPVFVPAAGDGRTMAEMAAAEKDALSHRGAALHRLAAWLAEHLGEGV
jgi:XTP/dITP diphosphohydrolase